jgi:peptide/nickel transport system substrate-binding protein
MRAASAVAALGLCGSAVAVVGGTTAAAPRPHSSSTFVVADSSTVQKIDPQVATNFLDLQALGLVYDTLVKFNSKLVVSPDLATKWKLSNGGRTVTFTLRKGVKFDDGHTFTSADVAATVKRAQNPATGASGATYVAAVTKVLTPNANTAVFQLSHPDNSLLYGLTSTNLSMISKTTIAAGTVASKPDGTGPFRFSSWSPGNSFTVVRNSSYWGGHVTLGKVEIKTVPSDASIGAALLSNTAQLGLISAPTVVSELPSTMTKLKVLDLSYRAIQLQDHKGPIANVDNRLAMSCALDRKQVLDDAVQGHGRVVGPVPVGEYASNPISAVCPTQNLSLARHYLKLAGNPKGFSFTAMISDEVDATDSLQAAAVQSQLAKVGIHMNINSVNLNAYIQNWLGGNFQAAFAENGANPYPYTMYGRYFGPNRVFIKPSGFNSPQLQHILFAGDTTTSIGAQKKYWKQLSTYMTANAVWLWLFDANDYAVTAPGVHGFTFTPTRSLQALSTTTVS